MAPSFQSGAQDRSSQDLKLTKTLWRRARALFARSRFVKGLLALIIGAALRFIDRTNRHAEGSDDLALVIKRFSPAIVTLWHGQHLLAPVVVPERHRLVALFSRSADAELNALVAQKLGVEVIRGSGGRQGTQDVRKGGARALIKLKRIIDSGCDIAMIADISRGAPREAGLGVVVLGRLSGRPIVPIAIATSRRWVLKKTWDKTTINLPFGRRSIVIGEPVYVPANASKSEMENKRALVTDSLNRATRRAYALVDGEQ